MEKIKLNSKNILSLYFVFSVLVSCSSKEALILKEQVITKELGETVSVAAKEYLVEETAKEILDKTVLSSPLMEDEAYVVNDVDKTIVSAEKEFLSVGEYIFTLTYDESESKEVKVVVKDTTAPTFNKDFLKEIKVEQNAKDVDFNAFYSCDDLSGCKVEADKTSVDLSKIGEYTMKVVASDEYENKVEQEVKVIVVSMEEARKKDGVTKTLDGKVYQSEALVKKLEEEKKASEAKKAEEEAKKSNSSGNNNSNKKPNGGSNNSNSNGDNNYCVGVTKEECERVGGTFENCSCKFPEPEPVPEPHYEQGEEDIAFAEMNKKRQELGKGALIRAKDLDDLADIRTKELVDEYKNGTVHDGMQKYDPMYKLGEVAAVGDNMFLNGTDVVNGWMHSPAHHDIIMDIDKDHYEVGISCYTTGLDVYWIAVLRK